jgi:hypothetical protein
MWKRKGKLPQRWLLPTHASAKQSDQGDRGGVAPSEDREIMVSRVWQFSPWVLGMLAGALVAPAAGQNLDAGKPAAQIFSEVCANCHRSARDFRNGASSSFLREHYTTGSDMASNMAAYLSAFRSDPRTPSQPNRPASAATTRETSPADPAKDARRTQQTGDAKGDSKPGDAKSGDAKSGDAKSSPVPTGSGRTRPASARAEAVKPATTAETKPPVAAAPPVPPLEDFEE